MIKYPISVKKKQYFEEKHMDLLLGEEGKMNYVLIKNLIRLCMIIHYTAEENSIVIFVY